MDMMRGGQFGQSKNNVATASNVSGKGEQCPKFFLLNGDLDANHARQQAPS